MSDELPEGWVSAEFRDIATIKGGITKGQQRKRTDILRKVAYLRVANVQRGFLDLREIKEIEATEAEIDVIRLKPGDILLIEGGNREHLGRGWIWQGEIQECIHQNHVFRARLLDSRMQPRYFSWYANQVGQGYFMAEASQTVNLASINLTKLSSLPVAIPPIAEQKRIVAKVEDLLARVNAARERLSRVPAILKRFRQSVLAAACSGRLTEDWREKQDRQEDARSVLNGKQDQPEGNKRRAGRLWGAGEVPELTEEERGSIPENWTWAKVGDLGPSRNEAVQVGPMSMKSSDFEETGVPVLNVGCVQWGYFDKSKLDYMPPVKSAAFDRYRILPGDVLFTRSGTVGRCAVATETEKGHLMTFHLLRVRPDASKCSSHYLRFVFQGAAHIRRQTDEAAIGSTRAGFNTNLLAGLDVPLPPPVEQRVILLRVEALFALADTIEKRVAAATARVEKLTQAILAKAFRGELVPTEAELARREGRDYEPAAALLERIRAERPVEPRGTRGTRGKKK